MAASGSRTVHLGNGRGRGDGDLWKDFKFDVPGFHDEVFWDWKDVIVASEMQILKRLGFNMQVSPVEREHVAVVLLSLSGEASSDGRSIYLTATSSTTARS